MIIYREGRVFNCEIVKYHKDYLTFEINGIKHVYDRTDGIKIDDAGFLEIVNYIINTMNDGEKRRGSFTVCGLMTELKKLITPDNVYNKPVLFTGDEKTGEVRRVVIFPDFISLE